MNMEMSQCCAEPSDFPERKKRKKHKRGQELSNTNANPQNNFPEEISLLKNVPLEPLTNTSNGVVPMEVMDTATVPPVNISTDSIPTSEKKKKRKKPRRSENSKTTISIADDNFKGVSLEKAIAQISPCLKSSTGIDGTVDSFHLPTFEDTIPKEKTITTDNDSFKGVSVENVKAERIDSQHHASFEDKLSKEDSCLKSLVCNDGTDLEHNTVTACLASSEKKKKWKQKRKQKRSNNCELLEGVSSVQNGLKQDYEHVKTSTERSVRMDSEGEKSGPVLGFVAEKDEQELKTKYNSSENHGLDHVMLDSVGASGPGQCSLFAVASLDSTDIKKKSLEPGPLDLNDFEKRCSFKKCRDSPLEATVLDSTNIKENSHSPGVAEICKRWKTIENDFKFSNSENSSLSFEDSIGHTSHFPDETNTCQESLVGIDSECHVLTPESSCFEKKEKERKKKSIACESINKICYLQDRPSAENNLTDHNEIDCVIQDNCCVVRQDVIDVNHLDKGCQDCPLEVTVLDSADIVNNSVSLGFTDVESSEKDRGDSLFNVAGLDSNDTKEKMASSGVTNFEGDCRDFNLDIEVLNTTSIKEKSFTSGEPSSVIERANTGFMNAHGGHAEVNNTLLESRGTKSYEKRETDRNFLVNQVKFSNLRNSSNSYEGRTGGTSPHQLDTMYAGDLLKRKLESRDLGVHALSEKISEDKLNKKAESNCSGDGHISKGKKEGMEISLAENSCTQSYLKNPSKLSVSEASFKQKCIGKLDRARIPKHESFHIVDGLNLMDNNLNNFSESDPLCGSSKSKSIQIETMMDEAPSSSHLGELKDDPDLDTVTKMDDLSLILNPSPERYLAVDSRKKLLILDVNGLLVDFVNYFPNGHTPDKIISKKAVFKRPYCDEFLQFCFDRFNVGVWSSRTKRNIDMVVEFLMSDSMHKLLFCWDQSHCTDTGYKTIENREKPLLLKELRKLWDKCDPELPWEKGEFNETNTLLLDDSPYKSLLNPAYTAVFPNSYTYHQTNDSSLGPEGDLRIYLEGLAIAENVQKYVEQNPFGQRAITKSNPSWNFYCKIISGKI